MGRSELLAKLEQEAVAWDSGSGDVAALLREAKEDIEHLAAAAAGHFKQAMLNGEAANEMRADAERYRKICSGASALEAFNAAYYNTQTKAEIDAAVDDAPDVGAA